MKQSSTVKNLQKKLNKTLQQSRFIENIGNGQFSVHTPFIDSIGDPITFIGKVNQHKIQLSDEGYTLYNAETNGATKQKQFWNKLRELTNYFHASVNKENENISIKSNPKNCIEAITNYTQLIIEINALI